MANNQDARPFVHLKNDAQEFETKFKEDIEECLNFLNEEITALICDPDSRGDKPKSVKNNTMLEFSKAKYDIFLSVKSLIKTKEQEWLSYISEMKKLFLENVEIFLAGTKLEVKLPPSEYQSSSGSRNSLGNRKSISSSVTSSVYPILSSITKNIPVLSSPRHKEDKSQDNLNVGNEAQFNTSGRLSAKLNIAPGTSATISLSGNRESSDISEDESTVGDKVQFNRRGRLSVKLNNPPRVASSFSQKDNTVDSSESESETAVDNVQLKKRGRQAATSFNLSKSTMQTYEEIDDIEMHADEIAQEPEDAEMDIDEADLEMQKNNASQIQKDMTVSRPTRGRRGKQPVQNSTLNNVGDSLHSKKLPGRSSKLEEAEINQCIEENGEAFETNVAPLKGRRGRGGSRNAVNNSLAHQVAESVISEDKEETTVKAASTKGRRGRSTAQKSSNNNISDYQVTDDIKSVAEEPPNVKVVSSKGRRGRSAPPKSSHNNVSENGVAENIYSIEEEEPTEELVSGRSYRSRSAAPKASDKNISTRKPARGRKSVRIVEEAPELAPSSQTSSDEPSESDLPLPVARPTKSTARRKTLLPTLEDLPGSEIIPGNPTRTPLKRKTICVVPEYESAGPSKRLKAGNKTFSSVQAENSTTSDNLLGNDDNYSDWMALRNIDGKIPTHPAVYEVKVWRAKKTAYIGSCESLRQKLTLYKLKEKSGNKHLDKFVDRNYNDIQVRFELVSSVEYAKNEVKNRVKRFVEQYKTTPAYN